MLKLRDYLAARTAIWRNQVSKDAAMALLRELNDSGRELSWLAFASERGSLEEATARAIHAEVERFEFARAEAAWIQAATRAGISQDAIEAARTVQRNENYSRRIGAVLIEKGAVTAEQDAAVRGEALREFEAESRTKLETFKNSLLTKGSSGEIVPTTSQEFVLQSPTRMLDAAMAKAAGDEVDPLDQPLDVNSTYVMSNPLKLSSAPAAFQPSPGAPQSGPMPGQAGPGGFPGGFQGGFQGGLQSGSPVGSPGGSPVGSPGSQSPPPGAGQGGGNYWSVNLQPSTIEETETVDMAGAGQGLLATVMQPNGGRPGPPAQSPPNAPPQVAPTGPSQMARQPGPPAPPPGLPAPPPAGLGDPGADADAGPDEASRQRAIELVGDPMLGSVLAETYDFQKLLGKGAMGKVFLARHRDLDKDCAVKLTQPKGRMAEEVIQRFKREILVTSLVTHPNVVEVYDADEMPDGTYVMAMEVLEGEELKVFLKRKGTLPPLLCLDIIDKVLDGLSACHEAGVVHRDIKPENLQIVERDEGFDVRIMDFGLARLLTEEEQIASQVFTSLATQVSGSPKYMAPESITDASEVDFRCDLYSVGVSLFELLTGKVPFEGKPKEILEHQLYSSVPRLEDVLPEVKIPDNLERLVRKLMEKDRDLRYQSCAEVREAIAKLKDELKSAKPPTGRSGRKTRGLFRTITNLFRSGRVNADD